MELGAGGGRLLSASMERPSGPDGCPGRRLARVWKGKAARRRAQVADGGCEVTRTPRRRVSARMVSGTECGRQVLLCSSGRFAADPFYTNPFRNPSRMRNCGYLCSLGCYQLLLVVE